MPANTVRVAPFADVERELQQLVGAVDVLGVDDARDAQVDLGEVVDGDRAASAARAGGRGRRPAARRRRARRGRRAFEQRVDLLRVDARHQVLVGADRTSGDGRAMSAQTQSAIGRPNSSARPAPPAPAAPARAARSAARKPSSAFRADVLQLVAASPGPSRAPTASPASKCSLIRSAMRITSRSDLAELARRRRASRDLVVSPATSSGRLARSFGGSRRRGEPRRRSAA